jgi:hypothetical protein
MIRGTVRFLEVVALQDCTVVACVLVAATGALMEAFCGLHTLPPSKPTGILRLGHSIAAGKLSNSLRLSAVQPAFCSAGCWEGGRHASVQAKRWNACMHPMCVLRALLAGGTRQEEKRT